MRVGSRFRDRSITPVVVSLRPVNDHATMRRAAAVHGMTVVALSPWRIVPQDDPSTRRALRQALAAQMVIVTSPAAARAAASMLTLRARRGQSWFALGDGTASALRKAGIEDVITPRRADSEGLLDLPALRAVRGRHIGLLTAPGGRDRIAAGLRQRGAAVRRADVYRRELVAPTTRALARLRALDAPWWLPISSGEALQRTFASVPPDIATRLRGARAIAASARIATIARACGCRDVRIAAGARPAQLLAVGSRPGNGV